MSLNTEFTCGLDDVDTQNLIITDENFDDYSSFSFIFKNESIDSYFTADSMYISSEQISSFIEKISNYENEIIGELFNNNITDNYSVNLNNKILSFSVMNCFGGFTHMDFKIKINNDNIQDVLNVFNKLFDFKKKFEECDVGLSEVEEYDEEQQTDENQVDETLLF